MKLSTVSIAAGLALAVGCGDDPHASPPAVAARTTDAVYTSFYPTQYFAERIGGGALEVVCPLPPDADPIFWQPPREVIAAMQSARLVILNGAGFEKWVETVSLPPSRVVDTSAAFAHDFLTYATVTHSHGTGEHTHEGLDGHTWLDPLQAKQQAAAIRDALVASFPERKAQVGQGLAALARDLDELHALLEGVTAKIGDARLLASHPAYEYLARRYGWELESFDLDPDAALGSEQLQLLVARKGPAKTVLLWESAPNDTTIRSLLAEGVRSVVFSPCELLDPSDTELGSDYLEVMQRNVARLEQVLTAD